MQAIGLTRPGLSRIGAPAGLSLVPGAVALWLCNAAAGSTTLADSSGRGLHGTLGTGAAQPTFGPTGLSFDGGDHVTFGVLPAGTLFADAGRAFTLQIVYTYSAGFNVVAQASNTPGNRTFVLGHGGTAMITTTLRGAVSNLGTPAAWPAVVTVTWNGSAAIGYIGAGEPVALSVGTADEEVQALLLGARTAASPTGQMTGTVYGAGIWPYALSREQTAQNVAMWQALLRQRGVTLP
jgi:hypothetical protein